VSWEILLVTVVLLIFVQAGMGLIWVLLVWPWSRGRKITELMLMAAFATTAMVAVGAIAALIGRKNGDYLLLAGVLLMWIGQLPFMFAALPVMEWKLAEQRRQAEKLAALDRVRDDGSA